mmetsp:Transcript_47791/g.139418  ORF Transcript_47791/g.139418 Transcript_47791/m.139418 type:complete len:212 (-) Transcript_47791:110-745(-)
MTSAANAAPAEPVLAPAPSATYEGVTYTYAAARNATEDTTMQHAAGNDASSLLAPAPMYVADSSTENRASGVATICANAAVGNQPQSATGMGGSVVSPRNIVAQLASPAVFTISSERFAQIVAGVPLTPQEIAAITRGGGGSVATESLPVLQPMSPVMQSMPVAAPTPAVLAEPMAPTSNAQPLAGLVEAKSASKKKSLKKGSQKKSKRCC